MAAHPDSSRQTSHRGQWRRLKPRRRGERGQTLAEAGTDEGPLHATAATTNPRHRTMLPAGPPGPDRTDGTAWPMSSQGQGQEQLAPGMQPEGRAGQSPAEDNGGDDRAARQWWRQRRRMPRRRRCQRDLVRATKCCVLLFYYTHIFLSFPSGRGHRENLLFCFPVGQSQRGGAATTGGRLVRNPVEGSPMVPPGVSCGALS